MGLGFIWWTSNIICDNYYIIVESVFFPQKDFKFLNLNLKEKKSLKKKFYSTSAEESTFRTQKGKKLVDFVLANNFAF